MARLHIVNLEDDRRVEVTLSRRNLLTLLHKLDMAGSMRQIENNDCWEDGVQTPFYPGEKRRTDLPRTRLVLRCENDDEHYANRPVGPGPMHPESERFVLEHAAAMMQAAVQGWHERLRATFEGGFEASGRCWIWHDGLAIYGDGESYEEAKADLLDEITLALDEWNAIRDQPQAPSA
jgi:hypothetical protein